MGKASSYLPDGIDTPRALMLWDKFVRTAQNAKFQKDRVSVPAWLIQWADANWENYAHKYQNLLTTVNVDYEDMFPEEDAE